MKKIFIILSFLFVDKTFACSCGGPDIHRMDKGSEFVVLAQLKSKSSLYSFSKNKYTFSMIKAFKGSTPEKVEVWTPKFEMSCGLKANYEVPYVLFVYREAGKLYVDHCSSWPLTKYYYDYTHEFNEFYKLTGIQALKPDTKESNTNEDN